MSTPIHPARTRLMKFTDGLNATEGGFIFSLHYAYPEVIDKEYIDAVRALVADLRSVLAATETGA